MSDLIDRQAAIDALLRLANCKTVRELFEYNAAHNLAEMWPGGINDAIDAIIAVPPAQLGANLAEVGTDCISRQAAIDAVNCVMIMKGIRSGKSVAAEAVESAKSIISDNIRQLPPIQPKRIRGRWTRDNACSECGCQPWFSGDIHNYNFCPNCGADMREVTG